MKFLRPYTYETYCGEKPIDMNDPTKALTAIELELPSGFSEKAHAFWDYLEGTAFLYEYDGGSY